MEKGLRIRTSQTLAIAHKVTDVLVIGGGGAACRAAIAAHDRGAEVLMILKGQLGRSGSTAYGVAEMAGFNVPDGVADPQDSPAEHARDIIEAGLGMSDPRLVTTLTTGAVRAKDDLEAWGVSFERTTSGAYLSVQSCFSNRPRTHILRGHGEPIIHALRQQIEQRNIRVLEQAMVTELIVEEGVCRGVVALREDRPEGIVIRAGAVIMATGGAGQLFAVTLNPSDITGDGYALAYRAGAEIVNMEFMQAAMGFIHPVSNTFNAWLWSVFPRLLDRDGNSLLQKYLPPGLDERTVMAAKTHYPFSCRDASKYLEIAVQKELAQGRGTAHGGVVVDFTGVDEKELERLAPGDTVRAMWPITRDWMIRRGVDIRQVPVEISTFGHAINGGIRINTQAQSTIPGLFAAGEVAGGPHGADRLGGNMMVTCQVFGRIAGENAAAHAESVGRPTATDNVGTESVRRLEGLLQQEGDEDPAALKRELAREMSDSIFVVRSAESLHRADAAIAALRRRAQRMSIAGRVEALRGLLELHNLATTAELIVRSATERKESRGSHYREDYPTINHDWDQPLFLHNGPDRPVVEMKSY